MRFRFARGNRNSPVSLHAHLPQTQRKPSRGERMETRERHASVTTRPPPFPMYVLPIESVLALDRLPTHEEVCGELVEWRQDLVTLFVSQTWLAYDHPDSSDNSKLRLLQLFLSDAMAGRKGIPANWAAEIAWGSQLHISSAALRTIKFVWLVRTAASNRRSHAYVCCRPSHTPWIKPPRRTSGQSRRSTSPTRAWRLARSQPTCPAPTFSS